MKKIIFSLELEKDKLTTQVYEKCLTSALKEISTYKLSNICIDLSNVRIKSYNILRGSIVEIEKAQYSYRDKKESYLKECSFKLVRDLDTKQLNNIIAESLAISNGVNKARMLGDIPSNICNPTFLAREAKKLEKN